MQAITVAIGKKGIEYFAKSTVAKIAIKDLKEMTPPNKFIPIKETINGMSEMYGYYYYKDVLITLSNGKLNDFNPIFNNVEQIFEEGNGNNFSLMFNINNFSAQYVWNEKYHEYFKTTRSGISHGKIDDKGEKSNNFNFNPSFDYLDINSLMSFKFNKKENSYYLKTTKNNNESKVKKENIPSDSVINDQVHHCFSSEVDSATAEMISKIDFSKVIDTVFTDIFASIPASGYLTDNIQYDFSVGDSGMKFPTSETSNGIQVGVTGKVKFKDEMYSIEGAPVLPLPPVPLDSDEHYLNIYVSDYEVNALYWAYFKDGGLNVTVRPSDLSNPAPLNTGTYIKAIPALKPYGKSAMDAIIQPLKAPITHFQQVYIFSKKSMKVLETELPSVVDSRVRGLEGDVYISVDELNVALTQQMIDDKYFTDIKDAVEQRGMVVTQNMNFTMVIDFVEAAKPEVPKPQIGFSVVRQDVMTDLKLGISGSVQTMKFTFLNAKNTVTFDKSRTTVPNFLTNSWGMGALIWPLVGEEEYSNAMNDMGSNGVPIPIMKGFNFLFDEAELRIEQEYISILANVEYKG